MKGDDDQGHEDVDEEEGKDDEVDDVEDGHLGAEQGDRRLVLERRGHRLLQYTEEQKQKPKSETLCQENEEYTVWHLVSQAILTCFAGRLADIAATVWSE